MLFQHRLNDAALNAAAAAVNEPNFLETGFRGGVDVLVHNRRNIARRKGVEIEFTLDRYAHAACCPFLVAGELAACY